MLVVMKHRNVQLLDERSFNLHTSGRADVFQVDAAESWCHALHRLNDFLRVFCIKDNGYGIDPRKPLEKGSLSFHHWKRSLRSNVPQTQHRCSIGDHRYDVPFPGIFIGIVPVLGDFSAGLCNARGIGHRKILFVLQRRFQLHRDFAFPLFMELQCFFIIISHRSTSYLSVSASQDADAFPLRIPFFSLLFNGKSHGHLYSQWLFLFTFSVDGHNVLSFLKVLHNAFLHILFQGGAVGF